MNIDTSSKAHTLIELLMDKSSWDFAQVFFSDRNPLLTDRAPIIKRKDGEKDLLVIVVNGVSSPVDPNGKKGTQTIVCYLDSITSITFFKENILALVK